MLDNQMDGGLGSFGLATPGAKDIRDHALGRIVPFQQLDIPLSSLLTTNTVYPIAGNFLTFSFDDLGVYQASWPFATQLFRVILMGPDGQPAARLPVYHGSVIRAPFYGVAFESTSIVGGGAFLRCIYGTNVDFVQHPRQMQVTPGNVYLRTLNFGTSHVSLNQFRSTALLAGSPENIVTVAQNTSGIYVQFATLMGDGSPHIFSFGTAAPSAATDNNVLLLTDQTSARVATLPHPRTIPANNRLDRMSSTNPQIGPCLAHACYILGGYPWIFP